MGFLDWLSGNLRFQRYDDSFALTRSALWALLRSTIKRPEHEQKSIWMVCHFPETFSSIQSQLEQWGQDYVVVENPISTAQVDQPTAEDQPLIQPGPIKLVLADLIETPSERRALVKSDAKLALMVIERHPLCTHDQRIDAFARSLSVRVELGYFMSLEDKVVKDVVNDTTLQILKQLGMNDHELIASQMLTRRLNKLLKRRAAKYTTDYPADSAAEWLTLNHLNDPGTQR